MLSNGRVFEDRKIELAEVGADEGVAPFIAKMTRAWNAAIREPSATRGGISAWNRERSEVQEFRGIAGVMDWPHNVWPAEAPSTAIVIIFKVVIQMERLPGLNGDDAIQAPAISNLLPAALLVGKLINEIPRKSVAHVKVRIAAIG